MTAAIEIRNLSVSYDAKPVLLSITMTLERGQLVGLLGPNGAGKSTLFRAIVGLVPLSGGRIRLLGGEVKENRRWVAYVPQREAIDWNFPIIVEDAVLMGRFPHLGWGRRPSPHDRRVAQRCLQELEIAELQCRQIGELSGGQQQRVFLARALAQEAQVLLLDEPFVGVDAATEQVIFHLLARLRHEGKTVLVVDHDLNRAARHYDCLALLNQRLVAYGPPQAVFTPDLLDATYAGRLALLEALGVGGSP
ncbi:MAG: metal ABC transporter ATP-binding protein [Candidatus Methylomirabilales bacterium]